MLENCAYLSTHLHPLHVSTFVHLGLDLEASQGFSAAFLCTGCAMQHPHFLLWSDWGRWEMLRVPAFKERCMLPSSRQQDGVLFLLN